MTWSSLIDGETIVDSIGRVLVLATERDEVTRRVVLCYPYPSHVPMIEIAAKLGIEFMTPEEFVDGFRTDLVDQPNGSTSDS